MWADDEALRHSSLQKSQVTWRDRCRLKLPSNPTQISSRRQKMLLQNEAAVDVFHHSRPLAANKKDFPLHDGSSYTVLLSKKQT